MYVYALAHDGPAPGPDDMEKRGRRGRKGEEAGGGAGGYAGDRACWRDGGGSLQPSWGSAHPRRASGTEAATWASALPAADR